MRNVWLICFSVALVSCVKPTLTKVPSYEEAQATVMKRGALVVPPIEERMNYNCSDKPTHTTVPIVGVVFTNDRAECILAQLAERDRLRKELEAERLKSQTKDIILSATLQRTAEMNQPSWWDRYSGSVLLTVGAVLGAALTISIVYAVTESKTIVQQEN